MAQIPEELFHATAAELNRRLVAREFSAKELARAFCDRLERLGGRYNALALLMREEAVRRAESVDKELKRGRTRGPLQGVPYGAKDLLSYPGRPTTWGAKPYAGQVLNQTATVLAKLDAAGCPLAAKLSMVELAGGGGYRFPAASLFGAGVNPWDRSRWSGGSSSGSASAVAAGLVPFALGSETSGSIVTPAAFCGLTGLRPTYGLVSRYGAMALSWTMDKIGPLARSAEDCGHILQAISGPDPLDPASAGRRFFHVPQYAREPKSLRIGWAPADFEVFAAEPVRPALQKGLEALRTLGSAWKPAALPDLPYGAATGIIIAAEASAAFAPLIESGRVNDLADARQIEGLKAASRYSAKDYLQAMQLRRRVSEAFARLFGEFDVLVSPARFDVAPKLTEPLDRPSGAVGASSAAASGAGPGFRALIPAGNLAGLPALVLPCGLADGLPVALQIVGRPFSENTLLRLGSAFQGATDWHKQRAKF
jgi:aspartyl-tRNA(Asn)/glutamyl-tRNA(Gln) amidotransferase subunit A